MGSITSAQFELLKARLGKARRAPCPVFETTGRPERKERVILGIDPSLRSTGYGLIQCGKGDPVALAQGAISCPAAWERSRCLANITRTVREIVATHRPGVCAMEGLFYAQNLQTALILGEARGAALAAIAEAGLEIFEISPRKVKQALSGYGAAHKPAVAKMVQRLLHLTQLPQPDAADALAIALAYWQDSGRYSLWLPKRI